MTKNNLWSDNRGLSIVEALAALLILTLGIIPSFLIVLLGNSLSASVINNLIASNLAQEGIEVTRSIRDSNWMSNTSFDSGLADGTYRVVWNSTALLPESGNPVLKRDANGLYNYTTGIDTSFVRKIIITKIDPTGCNCELKIVSEISWAEKKNTRTISVESHLFNWR